MQRLRYSFSYLKVSLSTFKISKLQKTLLISLFIVPILAVAVFSIFAIRNLNDRILEDIDFLIYHMEESFPFFGVIERRLEIDLREELLELRRSVSAQKLAMSERNFYLLLRETFSELNSAAHLAIIRPDDRANIEERNNFYAQDGLSPPPSSTLDSTEIILSGGAVVSTSIIEKDKIAYLLISNMTYMQTISEWENLRRFLLEVRDYEHLIIDIRPTRGGHQGEFLRYLVAPNLSEDNPLNFYSFAFFNEGELAEQVAEYHIRRTRGNFHHASFWGSEILEAKELVEKFNLIHINKDDLEGLAYGYKIRTSVPHFDRDVRFNGKIWLLTSSINGSASEAFARLSKEAGFTLVGETTGAAIGGGGTAHFRLPNTKIGIRLDTLYITDDTGRAKEEFPTEPHYHISPGEDALDVTLELIRQGR